MWLNIQITAGLPSVCSYWVHNEWWLSAVGCGRGQRWYIQHVLKACRLHSQTLSDAMRENRPFFFLLLFVTHVLLIFTFFFSFVVPPLDPCVFSLSCESADSIHPSQYLTKTEFGSTGASCALWASVWRFGQAQSRSNILGWHFSSEWIENIYRNREG